MKITDGTNSADIKLIGLDGIEWTEDFFNADTLEKNDNEEYVVEYVQDYIDAVTDYYNHVGEFGYITDTKTKLSVNGELVADCKEEEL